MLVYDNTFEQGYQVHLCMFDDQTGYLIIMDQYTGVSEIQYFTDIRSALAIVADFKKN